MKKLIALLLLLSSTKATPAEAPGGPEITPDSEIKVKKETSIDLDELIPLDKIDVEEGFPKTMLKVFLIKNKQETEDQWPSTTKILLLDSEITIREIIETIGRDGYKGSMGAEILNGDTYKIKILEAADMAKKLKDLKVQESGCREAMFFYENESLQTT